MLQNLYKAIFISFMVAWAPRTGDVGNVVGAGGVIR